MVLKPAKSTLDELIYTQVWRYELLFVFFCVRVTFKEDLSCSPAKSVYGQTFKIPDKFSTDSNKSDPSDTKHLIDKLQEHTKDLRLVEPRTLTQRVCHEPKDLATSSYHGRFPVLRRFRKL